MTKKRFLEFGFMGLMIAAVIVGFSTRLPVKKTTPPPAPVVYSFDYYPKANVYFNRAENKYTFLQNGKWQTAPALPASPSFVLDKKVEITGRSADIWKDNDRHRMVYSVALYASASDLKEPPPKPVIVSAPKETDAKKDKNEVKKERGLKGFFRKIFKKKKQDA